MAPSQNREHGHVSNVVHGLTPPLLFWSNTETLGHIYGGCATLQPLFRLFQNLLLKFQLHFPSHLLLHAFPIHGLTKSQDHLTNLLLALANMASMQVDKEEAGWGGTGDCGAYFQSLLNLCLQAEFL